MCGIAGFLGFPRGSEAEATVRAMTDAIAHRGPDGSGAWCDAATGIALGHRRLSIIDLSPDGAQPMTSASGRYVISFNGEAYNFAALRDELARGGYPFRGHSDTEVLLAAFERWGVRESIPRFAGMFAIAVWDREAAMLTLARDRLGEKPLYYGRVDGRWLFASELKSLRRFPGWSAALNAPAVAQLLRHGYIQAPLSIYEGIHKVRPGTLVELSHAGAPREHVYWSAATVARTAMANPLQLSDAEVASELDALLKPIVRDEMTSDVPLGAFLSGGIDSSLIVALMQSQSARPVRTFTIGFDNPDFNEAEFAQRVASHLGTDHTEMTVRGDDALALVPLLGGIFDEPMADASQLPTLLVSQLTRRHVTVALSGDGGDELFGGYQHHQRGGSIASLRQRIPGPIRSLLGPALLAIPDPPPTLLARLIADPSHGPGRRPANALTRLGSMLGSEGERGVYSAMLARTIKPQALLAGHYTGSAGSGEQEGDWLGDDHPLESRMLFDTISYLPDDVLVKVDRASMAHSLETRAPLLDHRVFEFAWRLPFEAKVRDGVGKRPLRELLFRYVPRTLVDRPKRGFAVPLASWLKGPLRPWAESLLSPSSIREAGVLDDRGVRRLWTQHVDGVANHANRLWAVLALCSFLEAERNAGSTPSAPARQSA